MTFALLLATALGVLPADRLMMADRLFNRGDYAAAKREYAALNAEKSIAADELKFREAEVERALGNKSAALLNYSALISNYPGSRHLDRARLEHALLVEGVLQERELAALDDDGVPEKIRAAALYHLGLVKQNAAALRKSLKFDPHGDYATYASFQLAKLLSKSEDAKLRREAVSIFLALSMGKDARFQEESFYLAAIQCFNDARYGEASILLRRFLRTYPNSSATTLVRTALSWSEYRGGKFTEAAALVSDAQSDDFAYLKAMCAYSNSDVVGARAGLASYLERFPEGAYRKEAELTLLRLDFNEASGKHDDVKLIENAKRAAMLSGSATDQMRLAWAYEKVFRTNEAERVYVEVVKKFAGSESAAQALFRLAIIDLRAERWAAGEMKLAEAQATGKLDSRERTLADYWRGMAAVRLGHIEEGVKRLKTALSGMLELDEAREARLVIADCDYAAGRRQEALTSYATLLKEGAGERMNGRRLNELASAFFEEKDYESATLAAERLSAANSAEWRQLGFMRLGAIAERRESFVAALKAYRQAIAERPAKMTDDAAIMLVDFGKLEMRSGEYAAAEKTLKQAVDENAARPRVRAEAYLALAENALQMKDVKSARAYATVITALFDDASLVGRAEQILKEHSSEMAK